MTIRDSAEDSAAAAGDVLELCKMVNEPAEWWLVGLISILRVHQELLGVARVLRCEVSNVAERGHCGPHRSLPATTMTVSYGNVPRGLGTVGRGRDNLTTAHNYYFVSSEDSV